MSEPTTQTTSQTYRLLFTCFDEAHAVHLSTYLQSAVKHEGVLWKLLVDAEASYNVLLHLTIPRSEVSPEDTLRYLINYLFTAARECDLTFIRSYPNSTETTTEVHRIKYSLVAWPARSILAEGYPDGLPQQFLA